MAGPSGVTSRLALPYPIPDDTVDVPRDVKAMADALDPDTVMFISGTYAARPTASIAGRFYYTTDSKVLYYDNGLTWLPVNPSGGTPQQVSVLPSSPYDGQEVYYRTPAYFTDWHLRYYSDWNATDGYGWVYLGGAAMYSSVDAQEATSSLSYANLTTSGPVVSVPLAGIYDAHGGAFIQTGAATNAGGLCAPKFGTAAASDAARFGHVQTGATTLIVGTAFAVIRSPALLAGDNIQMQYRAVNASGASFGGRRLSVIPVRVR